MMANILLRRWLCSSNNFINVRNTNTSKIALASTDSGFRNDENSKKTIASNNVYRSTKNSKYKNIFVGGVTTAAVLIGGTYYWWKRNSLHALYATTHVIPDDPKDLGAFRRGLPTYKADDVAKHNTRDKKIWVTYKQGVYDITDLIDQHPGGSAKVLLASGSALEPFWRLYAIHTESDHAAQMLAKYRIGNFEKIHSDTQSDKDDPFSNDPTRNVLLIPSAKKPFNAEPPGSLLVDNYNTPNDLFYIRNHLPVPVVDVKSYRLSIGLEDKRHTDLTLDYIKRKFARKVVSSTIQCAGNRRSEFNRFKQVKGNNWNFSAIGNGEWGGVSLRDLFKYSGVNVFDNKYTHVQFDGLDTGLDNAPYGASIPIEVARQRLDDIIVAYDMNGQELSRDHGYPLRVIIPGVVGARQVKWLKKITLATEESQSHWQQLDYKGFNPSLDLPDLDYSQSVAICDLPVTSAICEPSANTNLSAKDEYVVMKGYAWSGGGKGIIRVDVSVDGGKTWHIADINTNEQNMYKSWAWTFWEAAIPVDKNTKELELICKATDVGYNVQPDNVDGVWNPRGVLNNSWHRVKVSRS